MPAAVAKRTLRGESVKMVPGGEGARDLVDLARTALGADAWLAALEDADTLAIIGAIGGLPRGSHHPLTDQAYREACASEGRWGIHFTVAPLRVDRATGSPVNPIAVL